MVDVGAATVDICGFTLIEMGGEYRYSLKATDIRLLGTLRLNCECVRALKSVHPDRMEYLDEVLNRFDPLLDLRVQVEEELLDSDGSADAIEEARKEIRRELGWAILDVIHKLKTEGDPKATAWKHGRRLPVLLIGGGSGDEFYRAAVVQVDERMRRNFRNDGVEIVHTELPDTFQGSPRQYFTVAWGLSHPAEDHGPVTPSDQVQVRRVKVRERPAYVSKDQV